MALEHYARQARNTEAERQALQIRIRAEERCGELLEAQLQHGGDRRSRSRSDDPTLKDLGISKQQSSDWQRLAAIPTEHFEADLADPMWRPTTAGLLERQDARERGPLPVLKGDEVFDWDAAKVRNTAMEADRKSRRRDFRKSSRSRLLGLVPARRSASQRWEADKERCHQGPADRE